MNYTTENKSGALNNLIADLGNERQMSNDSSSNLNACDYQIIAKYLQSKNDYINLVKTCKQCRYVLENFKFNPIDLQQDNHHLFPNIETIHIYSLKTLKKDPFIRQYIYDSHKPIVNWVCTKYSKQIEGQIHKNVIINQPIWPIPDRNGRLDRKCYAGQKCRVPEIIIPKSIYAIGVGCFKSCTDLTSITIPESIRVLESRTFANCSNLVNVYLNDYLTEIKDNCFRRTPKLLNIYFGKSLQRIGNLAFESSFTTLTELEFPDSLTYLGRSAFYYCSGLSKVTLPDNVIEIGSSCFGKCKQLVKINIPTNLTALPNIFENCTSLRFVKLPENIKAIKSHCFEDCTNLTRIEFNEGLTRIGGRAFAGCSNLALTDEYQFPSGVKVIGTGCFINCKGIKSVDLSNLSLGGTFDMNFEVKINVLSSSMFENCINLTRIDLPTDITKINGKCFINCSNLKEIDLKNVDELGFACFAECCNLTKVIFNGHKLGERCFKNCGFSEIDLKNVDCIEDECFLDCSELSSIKFGDSLHIGRGCFRGCSKLPTDIKIKERDGDKEVETNINAYIEIIPNTFVNLLDLLVMLKNEN